MGRDRWIFLAVRAYFLGKLDFSAESRKSDLWMLHEKMVLDEIERDYAYGLRKSLFTEEVHAAQYVAGDASFKYHYDEAERHYNELRNLVMPYDRTTTDPSLTMFQNLIAEHKRRFGKLEEVSNG